MLKYYFFIPATLLCLMACGPSTISDDREQGKHEIVQTEQDFAQMAQNEGIEKALNKIPLNERFYTAYYKVK